MSQGHANDFAFEVARGSRRGMTRIVLTGNNPDVDAAEDVWDVGGDVPAFSVGGFALEAISNDADDDGSPVGNGARTVTISGTTIAGVLQTETLTLNGVAAVASGLTWGFVNSAEVATAGSSLTNEGIITVRIPAGATKCQIAAGQGISDGAFYYVPVGYRLIVESVTIWSLTAGTTVMGVGRVRNGVFHFQAHLSTTVAAVQPSFPAMIPYNSGDLVKVRCISVSAVSQSVGAAIRGVLLDNEAV